MCSLPAPPRDGSRHPVDVGQCSEAVILAELVSRGYMVLTPFGVNHRYDLVIDCGDRFIRAQCKTGGLRQGVIKFRTRSVRSNTKKAIVRGYEGEIDIFLVFCPDTGKVYVVPIEEATRAQGSLRVEPTSNGQESGVRWAEDFALPA